MKKYICKECGKTCYSAVNATKDMVDPFCPYCGGEIKEAGVDGAHRQITPKSNKLKYSP